MRHRSTLFSCLLICFLGHSAISRAGGLISQFPKDGAWVRYTVVGTFPDKQALPPGTLSISSVGKQELEGIPCRWLEFKMTFTEVKVEHTFVLTMLIAEKELKPGTDFISSAKRRVMQIDEEPPVDVLTPDKSPEWLWKMEPVLTAGVDPDPRKEVGKLADRAVDYQSGKLIGCRGGNQEWASERANVKALGVAATLQQKVIRSVWSHKDIPFGVAACEVQHHAYQ